MITDLKEASTLYPMGVPLKNYTAEDLSKAYIEGAQWIAKQIIKKLKFASDTNAFTLDRIDPKDKLSLTMMMFCEAQIQQILNLMRIDKPLSEDDILKELRYISPFKQHEK